MDHFAAHAPGWAVALFIILVLGLIQVMEKKKKKKAYHHENAKSATAQRLSNIHILAMGVDPTPAVEEFLDSFITRDDNETLRAQHQTVNRTVFARPFLELQVGIMDWHLVLSVTSRKVRGPEGKGWVPDEHSR